MNVTALISLAGIGYLLAAVLYVFNVLNAKKGDGPGIILGGRICSAFGIVMQGAAIGYRCIATHHSPIATYGEQLSATAWSIAIATLAVEFLQRRKRPTAIGAVSYPLAFLALFAGTLMSHAVESGMSHIAAQAPTRYDQPLVSLHIIAILSAFGLLAVAVCCSLLYLVEHRLLKQKRIASSLFSTLPALSSIDRLAFVLVSLAFPLLTIGMCAGMISAVILHKQVEDWHTVVSIAAWIVYGAYLWLHATSTWRGVRVNYVVLVGLVVTILTYFAPSALHRLG